jgi:hypothetical protein
MKVTLAAAYGKHETDETVDLPESQARQLLFDGLARVPDSTVPATHEASKSTSSTASKEKP